MNATLTLTALLMSSLVAVAQSSSKAKPDLKELLAKPAFTNESGIVLIRVSSALWVSKYLITQTDYKAVTGQNPSQFQGAKNPVESVSWNDAMAFCARLTQQEKMAEMLPAGFVYVLPTQTEWEQLMDAAQLQHAVTSQTAGRAGTAAVGSFPPNDLGLYDARGNVWQFCLDPTDKPYRVLRGAAWDTSIEVNLRPEFRWYSNGPDDRKNIYGFRCVMKAQGQ